MTEEGKRREKQGTTSLQPLKEGEDSGRILVKRIECHRRHGPSSGKDRYANIKKRTKAC